MAKPNLNKVLDKARKRNKPKRSASADKGKRQTQKPKIDKSK